jgi:hypothetical protein
MCILHDQDEYGIIRWPLKQIAQAVHTSVSSLRKLVEKEVLKGADPGETCDAFTYTPRSGRKDGPPVTLVEAQAGPIWYSSRMVRDEYLRRVRGDSEPSPDPSPKGGMGAGKNPAPNPSPSHASTRPARPSSSFSDPDPSTVSSNGSFVLPRKDLGSTEENYTPPKNGGGEAPLKTPEQIQNFAIWDLGIQALRASGITDQNARSFIGRQMKHHGRAAVAAAVIETLAQGPVAPLEYIVAVLQKRGTEKQNGNGNGTNQTGTHQTAAERRNAATVRNRERARELRGLGDGSVESVLRRESGQAS